MKVYGQLEKAQLENTTSDTASHPKGMVTYRTDLNQAKVSNGTAYKLLIDEDSTQTLSNKTYASPITSGAITAAQTTTPANPSAGSNKLYFKADDKLYTLNSAGNEALVGSGAGSGVKNLITNGSADDTSSSIFVPYADAAATRPVDGTGGSPTVTTSVTSSSPLDGTKSFLLTKTAVNSQGQGWAVPFSVDLAYRAKSLKISADYIVNSGTFVAGANGASPVDGDVIWYIYDVTNSQLIEPSNIKMFSNSSSLSDKFEATFQTSATGSSYRLIAHVASTSALAFELKVDNVTVSPQTYVYGTPVTDWVSYTPTFTGFGTPSSVSFKSRRVGDSLQVEGYFVTGTNTGTTAQITAGYGGANANVTIDTSKVPAGGVIGEAIYSGTATTYFATYPLAPSANQTYINLGIQNSTTSALTATNGNTFANSSTVTVKFEVPIVGWSSSVQMSDTYDGRLVSTKIYKNGTQTFSTATKITSWTVDKDKTGMWDSSNNRFNIPSPGDYFLTGSSYTIAATTANAELGYKINGGSTVYFGNAPNISGSSNANLAGSVLLPDLKAGDYVEIYYYTDASVTVQSGAGSTFFSLHKLSSPQTIAASESVNARYATSAAQSIPNNTITIINYDTKTFDSHSAVTTGASWKYTAPVSGIYSVSAMARFTSATWTAGTSNVTFYVYKNGSVYSSINVWIPEANLTAFEQGFQGTDLVKLVAGDYIDIRINQASGGSLALQNTDQFNYVCVSRVGN